MTGPKGNWDFLQYVPKTFNVPQGKTFFALEGITKNLRRKFLWGQSLNVLLYLKNIEQTAKKIFAYCHLAHKFAKVSRCMGWPYASQKFKLLFP